MSTVALRQLKNHLKIQHRRKHFLQINNKVITVNLFSTSLQITLKTPDGKYQNTHFDRN